MSAAAGAVRGGPLRLLFLSAELASRRGTGGVGSYVATVTRALAARGHEVHVLSCGPDAAWADELAEGVAVHTRPLVRVRGLARVLRAPLTRHRLVLALSNYRHARALGRFDAVEAPDWQAEGLLFALAGRCRLVAHLHTPHRLLTEYNGEPVGPDARLADLLERTAVRRAGVVTCPSRLLVEELCRRGWLGAAPIRIIRYPVDHARFPAASAAGTPPRVLFVGRVERRKGPERLVRALAELNGAGGQLVLAGRSSGLEGGRPYGEWVGGLAAELGVDVRFAGELMWDELPALYAASRVVCVPSVFESFSMAAAEGMAAARPVVVCDQVGAAELLAGGRDGQVARADPASIAAALRPYLADPAAAERVGRANRERLVGECDPDLVAAQREQVYR